MEHKLTHAALVGVAAMWGMVFVANHELLATLDAVQIVTIRFMIITIVFSIVFLVAPSTRPRLVRRDLRVLLLAGLLAVPGAQLAIVQGQRYLAPPLVAMIMTTVPVMAAGLSWVFLRERLSRLQLTGFLVAFVGASVVILAGTAGRTELTVDNPLGATVTLITPLSWAGYTVLSKSYADRYHPVAAVGVAMILGTATMAPLWPHAVSALDDIDATEWGWLAYNACGGTVFPYLIWVAALKRLTAGQTATYMYGVPLMALLWSWLILDFLPTFAALVGGLVIVAGVALAQLATRPPRFWAR